MNSQQRGISQCGRASFSPKSCEFPGSPYLPGTDAGVGNPGSVPIPAHLKAHHMPPEPPIHQSSPLTGGGHNVVHHFHHSHSRVMSSPHTRGSPLAVSHSVDASIEPPGVPKGTPLFPTDLPPGTPNICGTGEWSNERQRELEEARARTAQMEKTMRWWSDCTANWREKWAKVRNERNKAREEVRSLRHTLEKTRRELEDHRIRSQRDNQGDENGDHKPIGGDGDGLLSPAASNGHTEGLAAFEDASGAIKRISLAGSESSNASAGISAAVSASMEDQLRARLVNEREEKVRLLRTLDQLQNEVILARNNATQSSETHQLVTSEKDTDVSQIEELRRELERLQQENAAEWARRDRLESEKLALERENKRLHSLLSESEKTVSKELTRSSGLSQNQNSDPGAIRNSLETDSAYRLLLQDNEDKDKEITELRRVCNRQRRQLEECGSELEHSHRRIDQYEVEVRKLRSRIDVLKHDLLLVESELDSQSTACRRIGHSNEELTQQVSTLQMQLEHAQRRSQSDEDASVRRELDFQCVNESIQEFPKTSDSFDDDDDDENLGLPNTVSDIQNIQNSDTVDELEISQGNGSSSDYLSNEHESLGYNPNPIDVLQEEFTLSSDLHVTNSDNSNSCRK